MLPKITIFTAPKAFVGHIGVIQRNAIASWMSLRPTVDILLLGSDDGVAEVAAELGLRHLPEIQCNEFGTPLLNSIWETAEANSSSPWLMEVNCDIILTRDLIKLAEQLDDLPRGLYVGLRSDLDVTTKIDMSDPRWEEKLLDRLRRHGRYRGAGDDTFNGTDYYIYPRGLYSAIPAFAIGRFFWDSWLNAYVRRQGLPLVDVSAQLVAIHQNHDYAHVKSAKSIDMYRFWLNPEANRNFELMGGFDDLFGPREASHKLAGNQLVSTGKSLEELREYNRRMYRPIALRASWFFRLSGMPTLWNHLFPFNPETGRHIYSRWGFLRWMRWEIFRPLWKILPRETRTAGHIIARELRAQLQRLARRTPSAETTNSTTPQPESLNQLTNVSTVWDVNPQSADLVCNWFLTHLSSTAGRRAIVPTELKGRITSAFGYGILNAKKRWDAIDLNIHHVILKRDDLEAIPLAGLRAICEDFNTVYRDSYYAILSRTHIEEHIECGEWRELTSILTGEPQETSALTGGSAEPSADVLAVLNVWKRGPDLLHRQLKGLLEQTEPPTEIWVCAFGVADPQAYEGIVEEFAQENIHFLHFTKNLKYHGRFQIALGAETTYVAFIDDDIVLGKDFLRQSRIAIETLEDAGEVGIYGWRRLPGPGDTPQGPYAKAEPHDLDDCRIVHSAELGEWAGHLPHERIDLGAIEVDLLCGYHFVRTDHIKYLFREQPWTFATGEDFQLAFALRKFAGMKSYVMPIDPRNPDTWGLSPDWASLRDEHASTVSDMLPVRDMLYWRLLNRGHSVAWMREELARDMHYLFAAFSSPEEAEVLYRAIRQKVRFDEHLRVLALYCGTNRKEAAPSAGAFGLNADDQSSHAWSWLDMELGREAIGPCTDRTRAMNTIYGIGALVDSLKPDSIWFIAGADPVLPSAIEIACCGHDTKLVAVPLCGSAMVAGEARGSLRGGSANFDQEARRDSEVDPVPAPRRTVRATAYKETSE